MENAIFLFLLRKRKLFLYFSLLHKKLFKFPISSPWYAFILSNHILSRLLTIPTPCNEFFHLCIMYHFLYYSIHYFTIGTWTLQIVVSQQFLKLSLHNTNKSSTTFFFTLYFKCNLQYLEGTKCIVVATTRSLNLFNWSTKQFALEYVMFSQVLRQPYFPISFMVMVWGDPTQNFYNFLYLFPI